MHESVKKLRAREQRVTPYYAQLGGVDGNGKLHAPRHLRHEPDTHKRKKCVAFYHSELFGKHGVLAVVVVVCEGNPAA